MPSKPTEQEMTEILALGMGGTPEGVRGIWPCYVLPNGVLLYLGEGRWNPFADPEGLGPVREVEKRLSEEQWGLYIRLLYNTTQHPHSAIAAIRHASPAICAEALARVFEPGRFE